MPSEPAPATSVLVVLADLAFSAAEGIEEAVALAKSLEPFQLRNRLSPEVTAWLPATDIPAVLNHVTRIGNQLA